MRNRNRKLMSILLTLSLLVTLLVPMVGPASASTTLGSLSTPTVVPPSSAVKFGTMTFTFDTLGAGTHSAVISLPNTDYSVGTVVYSVDKQTGGPVSVAGASLSNSNEFRLDVTAAATATDVLVSVTMGDGNTGVIPSDADGVINAKVKALSGQMISGDVPVLKAASGAVTVYVDDSTLSFNEAGTTGGAININLQENAQNGLKKDTDTIKFTLPKGLTWAGTPALTRINDGTALTAPNWTISATGSRTISITRAAADATAKSIFRFAADVSVDASSATLGDVSVDVGGTSSASPATLMIGSYVDFGVDVTAKETKEVKAGRIDQKLGKFEIKEKAADSLLSGRTVSMKLPAGLKWATIPAPTISGGGPITIGTIGTVGTDGREVKFTVTNPAAGGKGTITFENVTVDAAVDFSGDATITFGGSAGASGPITVGTAVKALTASADGPNMKIGVQSQDAGKITMIEGYKEALKVGNLTLTAPVGVYWSKLPTVTVKAGNAEVDTKSIARSNNVLTIPISAQSSQISTIEVSDIQFTIDRTVPEGPIEVKIGGPAIDEVNDSTVVAFNTLTRTYQPGYVAGVTQLFPQNTDAAKVINGKCVTPAPESQKLTSTFKIGESKFTLNGAEVTMDVAPYLKNDRTYLPIRYVAQALGVADSNIMWNAAEQSVVMIKGDRVVKLTIGSTTMLINGVAVTMDVAPEVVDPGRTMLPLRWVSQALGANIAWDNATQSVTIN